VHDTVDGVQPFRAVEGEDGDAVVALIDVDGLVVFGSHGGLRW
jgi:hypothetical protein